MRKLSLVWLVHLYGDYFWGGCLIALLENGDMNKKTWLFWWLHRITTLDLLPAGNEATMKCLVWNPQLLVCVFHTYPLTEQSCYTQTGTLNYKQITTSAFGNNAYKSIWLLKHTSKSSLVCAVTHSYILNTHTGTHRHARTLLVCSFCQLSPSACRLCVWHPGEGLEQHTSCVLCLGFTHSKWALWMARTQWLSQHQGPHSTRSDNGFWR